jgi:RNA polymerase sigma-70 factor (ECF subfamily)
MMENPVSPAPFDGMALLERHYKELLAFFSHSLRDRDAASDVVQESYARLLAMGQHTAITEPRALLYRIGKNIVLDGMRRHKSETKALDTLAVLSSDSAPSVEWEVDVRQRLDRILARLAVMPKGRRDAFILVRIYGYNHADAAARIGTTVAAIEKHIVRAVMDCMDLVSLLA